MIEAAIAVVTERRRETVHGLHLLYALTQADDGPTAVLLAKYESSAARLNVELERAI